MRFADCVLRVSFLFAALSPAGCGGEGHGDLLPALDQGAKIVLEAEQGEVTPAMRVEDFVPRRHPKRGLQQASGGKCVSVPKGANTDANGEKIPPKGKVVLTFSVPKRGKYYIYPRTWWKDGCGNSFKMVVDQRPPVVVEDGTYEVWHWITLRSKKGTSQSRKPRPFPLKEGEHTVTFYNREDHARLDQVYVTDDPDDRPTDIMEAPDKKSP